MKIKKIANVVFYEFNGEHDCMRQACIFYNDGTVKNVSYEEGLDAAKIIAREERVSSKESFTKMINSKRIYKMSGKDLENRFKEFIVNTQKQNIEEDKLELDDSFKIKKPMEDIYSDSKKDPNKKGIIRRALDKIKKSKLVRRITAVVTALAIGLGCYTIGARKSFSGKIKDKNIVSYSATTKNNNGIEYDENSNTVVISEAKYYRNNYLKLLKETTNTSQKNAMTQMSDNLDNFNDSFASSYVENGKDIKAALSWDEMISLKLAYNDYQKDEIIAIFNGGELNKTTLNQDYKSATLQLMGAYVIETKENPVNLYQLVNSEEGKNFIKKYEDMFLECKNLTGQAQINKVNEFYKELHKDFPITEDVREVGISHSTSHKSIESYKLAVTPIVAASEMMFQNLEINHTLSNKAINYFNDLGLCNLADEKFETASYITLSAQTDENSPKYEAFKTNKENELIAMKSYVIDDEHRELSELDSFKNWVNKQYEETENKSNSSSSSTIASTYTTTTYKTKTTKEEVSSGDHSKVDKQIEKENSNAKSKAEETAEKNRKKLQEQADRDAEKAKEEVKKDEKDMQNKIDKANDKITNGDTPVNENDFGDHNVNFDDEHSDKDGNLDDSVKDITTDPSNDQTNEELPDPNKTGAIFDNRVSTQSTEKYTNNNGEGIYEYEVNAYIERMADSSASHNDNPKVYTK